MTVASLVYKINADASSFGREMRYAERDVQKFQRRAESKILKVGKAFATMGGLAATGFVAMTRETISYAAELGAAADRTGMTTEELTRLQFAARESKVDIEAFNKRMERFNREVGSSEDGTGKLADVFGRYGIAVREADGAARSHTDILVDLADAVESTEDSFQAAELASAAFGSRGAAEMLPMLRQGGEAIEELTEHADDLGITLDQDLADAADQTERNFRELRDNFRALGLRVGSQTLPVIQRYSAQLVDMANDTQSASDEAESLLTTLQVGLGIVEALRIGFVTLSETIAFVAASTVTAFTTGFEAAERQGFRIVSGLLEKFTDTTMVIEPDVRTVPEEFETLNNRLLADEEQFMRRLNELWEQGAANFEAIFGDMKEEVEGSDSGDGDYDGFLPDVTEEEEKIQELERVSQRWIERTRTDAEAFEHEMQKVDEAFEEGFLTWEQWLKAEQMLSEQFDPEGLHAWSDEMLRMADEADEVIAEINGVDLALEEQIDRLGELHDEGLLTWDQYKEAVRMAKGETEELESATQSAQEQTSLLFDFAQSGAEALSDQLIDAIVDPFNQSLDEMAANFVQTLTRMALELAAQQALMAIFGGGGGAAGAVGGAMAFAGGGYVSGPGGPTSDSIPAYLSDGEYVLRAKATQSIGPSTLDFMNRTGKVKGYAAGGLVGGGSSGEHGTTPNIKILNIAGQSPEDFMRSKAGEQLVVNHVMKNADRMRQ